MRPMLRLCTINWMLYLTLMSSGCKTGDPCATSEGCKERGLCVGFQGVCIAAAPSHCLNSKYCQEEGHCSVVDGKCAVASSDDCRKNSTSVRVPGGAISAKDNASPDAPMHAVWLEKRFETSVGLMWRLNSVVASAIASPRMVSCQPGGDLDCRNAFVCKEWGRCSAHRGTCLAQRDSDCKKSRACSQTGACTAKIGKVHKIMGYCVRP